MDINTFEGYSDATHEFGIASTRMDGLDRFGRTAGIPDEHGTPHIHREGMRKDQAIEWLQGWIEDGGKPEAFIIVVTPRRIWETAMNPISNPPERR